MANINLQDGNGITFSLNTSTNVLTIQIDNAELNSIIQTFLNDNNSNLAKALKAITDRLTNLETWKDTTVTPTFTSNGLTTTSKLTDLVNKINGSNSTDGSFRKAVKDLKDDLTDGTITVKNADTVDNKHEAAFAASGHTHDDRYYTETEITNKLADKSDTGHKHTIANNDITDLKLGGTDNAAAKYKVHIRY